MLCAGASCVSPVASGRRDRHSRPFSQMRLLKLRRLKRDFPKDSQLATQQRPEPRPVSPASMPARPGPAARRRLHEAGPAAPTSTAPATPAGQVGRSPPSVHPVASGPGLCLTTAHTQQTEFLDGHSRLCASPNMATLACGQARLPLCYDGGTGFTCSTPWDHGGREALQHRAPGAPGPSSLPPLKSLHPRLPEKLEAAREADRAQR